MGSRTRVSLLCVHVPHMERDAPASRHKAPTSEGMLSTVKKSTKHKKSPKRPRCSWGSRTPPHCKAKAIYTLVYLGTQKGMLPALHLCTDHFIMMSENVVALEHIRQDAEGMDDEDFKETRH